jgi:transcriptional regulator with XRE-family HTH domain
MMTDIQVTGAWVATCNRAESSYEMPVYVRRGEAHSIQEAIQAGLLAEVMESRGHSLRQVAEIVGVEINTVYRWTSGRALPDATSLSRIESYILGYAPQPHGARGQTNTWIVLVREPTARNPRVIWHRAAQIGYRTSTEAEASIEHTLAALHPEAEGWLIASKRWSHRG